jgi:hypothetical protein
MWSNCLGTCEGKYTGQEFYLFINLRLRNFQENQSTTLKKSRRRIKTMKNRKTRMSQYALIWQVAVASLPDFILSFFISHHHATSDAGSGVSP